MRHRRDLYLHVLLEITLLQIFVAIPSPSIFGVCNPLCCFPYHWLPAILEAALVLLFAVDTYILRHLAYCAPLSGMWLFIFNGLAWMVCRSLLRLCQIILRPYSSISRQLDQPDFFHALFSCTKLFHRLAVTAIMAVVLALSLTLDLYDHAFRTEFSYSCPAPLFITLGERCIS